MSAYESIFATYARPALQSAFGRTITYTDATTGTDLPVTASVGSEFDELLELSGQRVRYRQRVIDDLSTAVAPDVKRPDTFTIDGIVWTVHEVLADEGG